MIQRGNTIFKAIPIPEFDSEIVSLYVANTHLTLQSIPDLEKTLDDVDFDTLGTINNNVLIHLTQEESLKFKYTGIPAKDMVKVHLRIRTEDEEAYSSQILIEQVGETINEEVI